MFRLLTWRRLLMLSQIRMEYSELTELEAIAEGGFGVIHRAKHQRWGTVVYKELKTSIISDRSRFVHYCCSFHTCAGFFLLRVSTLLLSVAEIQQNSEMLQKVDVYTADANCI